jgi:hypothetical protein
MSDPVAVSDPDLLQSMNGPPVASSQPSASAGQPVAVSDPELIRSLESDASAAPPDAKPGPNGLSWNSNGGYDSKTGELVIAGKPWSEAQPNAGVAFTNSAVSGIPVVGPYLEKGVQNAVAGIRSLTGYGDYDQNLDKAQSVIGSSEAAYPKTSTAGAVAGLGPSTGAWCFRRLSRIPVRRYSSMLVGSGRRALYRSDSARFM